ncbi:hypothetical protein C7424_0208 [Pantoea ananatis]|nr:hypothetical protein [Pantoea ananatis]REE79166.1 hypothetical protein C7424_0208 [Pantoea ananatis]
MLVVCIIFVYHKFINSARITFNCELRLLSDNILKASYIEEALFKLLFKPLSMEYTFFINALIGMRTEEVALCLNQVGR